MPSQITISKKNIRTMQKDIDLIEGRVDVGAENDSKEQIKAEEARVLALKKEAVKAAEEKMLRQLEGQERKVSEAAAQRAAAEKERAEMEQKEREAEKTAVLQEQRRMAQEDEHKKLMEELELERKRLQAEKEAEDIERKNQEKERARAFAEKIEHEKKRKAEIKKSEKEIILEEKNAILAERSELNNKKADFEGKKSAKKEKRDEALEKVNVIKENFREIEGEEKKIESQILEVEEKEASSKTEGEKKILERKRWQLEDKRHASEKNRWPWDEKIQEAENILLAAEEDLKILEQEEREILLKEKELVRKEEKNNLKLERVQLYGEIKQLESLMSSLEDRANILFDSFGAVKVKMSKILSEESDFESRRKIIGEKEKLTENLAERRNFEQERWNIEEKLRAVKTKKWAAEEEKKKIAGEYDIYKNKLQLYIQKKDLALRRIEQIKNILEGVPPKPVEVKKPNPEPKPAEPSKQEIQKKEESRIEVAKKRIEALKKSKDIVRQNIPAEKEEDVVVQTIIDPSKEEETPQERVKRIEDEKRDVKRLLAEDQKREETFSRISSPQILNVSENSSEQKQNKDEEIIRIIPQKPNWKEKIWARLVIVSFVLVVLAGMLTFWYWYFIIRNQPYVTNEPSKNQEITVIPESLFPMESPRVISILRESGIYEVLSDYFKENRENEGKFEQIVFEKNGKILDLGGFFTELQFKMQEDLLVGLGSDFTLFNYGQGKGRVGFIVKTKQEGLKSAIEKEELYLENGLKGLISASGEEKTIQALSFKNISQNGLSYRCVAYNQSDFGFCYYITDYYFIVASSAESIEKAIGETEIVLKRSILRKDLKINDQGEDVKTLQSWLAKDITIYPENLINGIFGEVTKKAIVRFQEKYAEEILMPQKLTKGTGIVDLLTRKKLNGLYSNF